MVKSMLKWFFLICILALAEERIAAQLFTSPSDRQKQKLPDSLFIRKYDTLLHVQSWISSNQMEYRLKYTKDFQLILSPNEISNLSLGFSYRFLELGFSFTPKFLNGNDVSTKGRSEKFSFGFGFSMHQFHLSFDITSVKGFYLKNSEAFGRTIPDSPNFIFPNLRVGYFSTLLQYNMNPRFSMAALAGGTQAQARSAWTIAPTFQFATFRFSTDVDTSGVQTEQTYSTDLNLIVPVIGTVVLSPKFALSFGCGPSLGVDFFKAVAVNTDGKLIITNGTKVSTGFTLQTALGYNSKRFYTGLESRYRIYGHKFQDLERLDKQYSYFQIYFGWRLRPPGFANRSLNWVNKVSPVKFD
jgi:hypothetical protein